MQAYLITDGQWGSCGKGLMAGFLAMERRPDVVVCNFGPNAGHTYITRGGDKIITSQLPVGLVQRNAALILGPGAIIDPPKLLAEIEKYDVSERLLIHPNAAIVTDEDKEFEAQNLIHNASTRKGVGAALAKRVLRPNHGVAVASQCEALAPWVTDDITYRHTIGEANLVQIEAAQGFELSLTHTLTYPYCTSRNITPAQILDDVAIPIQYLKETIVVVRTYPIRVGNEYDANGNEIGNSGPVYPDMDELTWEELSKRTGMQLEERTTVTNKVRRVFSWSWAQYTRMLWHHSPCHIMINFMNYLDPSARDHADMSVEAYKFFAPATHLAEQYGSEVSWLGYGPTHGDVYKITNSAQMRLHL